MPKKRPARPDERISEDDKVAAGSKIQMNGGPLANGVPAIARGDLGEGTSYGIQESSPTPYGVQETRPPDPRGDISNVFGRKCLIEKLNLGVDLTNNFNADEDSVSASDTLQHPLAADVHILAEGEQPAPSGLSVIADPGERGALEIFMKFLLGKRDGLKPLFDKVIGIREGCIVIKMLIEDEDTLENYMSVEKMANLEKELRSLVLNRSSETDKKLQRYIDGMNICVNREDLLRIRYFFRAEELSRAVSYTFCPEQSCWYWSPDGLNWMHDHVFVVQGGDFIGMKPQKEDLSLLETLWKVKRNPFHGRTCEICRPVRMRRTVFNKDVYWKSLLSVTTDTTTPEVARRRELKPTLQTELAEILPLLDRAALDKSMKHVDTVMRDTSASALQVAVLGARKSGKSAFIDAALGMDPHQQNSASAAETKSCPAPYFTEGRPGLVFWEIPAPSRVTFSVELYEQQMGIDRFDMCILLCSRVRNDEDRILVELVKDMKKDTMFLHSKTDELVEVPLARHPTDELGAREQMVKDEITVMLRRMGMKDTAVFMVSAVPTTNVKFLDFPLVLEHLIERSPATRRPGVVLALRPHSEVLMQRKAAALKELVHRISLGSAAANVIPIAGVAVDMGIFTYALKDYKKTV